MRKLIKNAIKCNLCGEIIESKHRYDYVKCNCGACFVDGGLDYQRIGFKEKNCFTNMSIWEDDGADEE